MLRGEAWHQFSCGTSNFYTSDFGAFRVPLIPPIPGENPAYSWVHHSVFLGFVRAESTHAPYPSGVVEPPTRSSYCLPFGNEIPFLASSMVHFLGYQSRPAQQTKEIAIQSYWILFNSPQIDVIIFYNPTISRSDHFNLRLKWIFFYFTIKYD